MWLSSRARCERRFEPVDISYVSSHLSQTEDPIALLQLFRTMPRFEQRHGLRVCQALERQGYADSNLLVAALLHDVGKTVAPPRLWERVLVVLWNTSFRSGLKPWGQLRRRQGDTPRFCRTAVSYGLGG